MAVAVAQGHRKTIIVGMGLGAVLLVGLMGAIGLDNEGMAALAWPIMMITGTGLGANVGEHYAKRPPATSTSSSTQVVVNP